ncbi:MAG: hypothetical protein ACXWR0_07455 [Bdellovibrio sp.]
MSLSQSAFAEEQTCEKKLCIVERTYFYVPSIFTSFGTKKYEDTYTVHFYGVSVTQEDSVLGKYDSLKDANDRVIELRNAGLCL